MPDGLTGADRDSRPNHRAEGRRSYRRGVRDQNGCRKKDRVFCIAR